jgi:hypothetical protein
VTKDQDPTTKVLIQKELRPPLGKDGGPKEQGNRFRGTILSEVKLKVRPSGLFKFHTVDDAPVEIKGKFAPPGAVSSDIEWVSTEVDGSFSCGERVLVSFLHDNILELEGKFIKLNGFVEYNSDWLPSYAIQCFALVTTEEFDAIRAANFVASGTINRIEFCKVDELRAIGAYVKMQLEDILPSTTKVEKTSAAARNLH